MTGYSIEGFVPGLGVTQIGSAGDIDNAYRVAQILRAEGHRYVRIIDRETNRFVAAFDAHA